MYLSQPAYGKFICVYLFLFVRILFLFMITWENLFFCENLFLSMIIGENLFELFLFVGISSYLCLSVKISSYLCSSVKISFMKYIFGVAVLERIFWGSNFKGHPWDNSFEIHFLREQLFWMASWFVTAD